MTDHTAAKPSRRTLLKATTACSLLAMTGIAGFMIPSLSFAAAMTRAQRDAMTPDDIIQSFKQGNARFRAGKMLRHDYLCRYRCKTGPPADVNLTHSG